MPQHPLLLAGTVRSNLDPFRHATDDELWAALDRVQLKKFFQEQPDGLDQTVAACNRADGPATARGAPPPNPS